MSSKSTPAELIERHRKRLRRMVQVRMDARLQGRLDPSDVLQDVYLEAHRRFPDFDPELMPPFLWLRMITGQKLIDLHRHHFDVEKWSILRERPKQAAYPAASSKSLAAELIGNLSSVSRALIRAEMKDRIDKTLKKMSETDREVLSLRHFEQLSNAEGGWQRRATRRNEERRGTSVVSPLTQSGQHKLDEYFDSVRSVERRIGAIRFCQKRATLEKAGVRASRRKVSETPPIEIKTPEGDKRSEYMQVMCDLNVLALQSDTTRVCTYIGSTPNGVSYPELGVNDQHHSQPITTIIRKRSRRSPRSLHSISRNSHTW